MLNKILEIWAIVYINHLISKLFANSSNSSVVKSKYP